LNQNKKKKQKNTKKNDKILEPRWHVVEML
jgi:hypothetical protein